MTTNTFQPLTEDQVHFFQTFGYLRLPGWFREEITGLTEAFDRQFRDNPADIIEWKHEAHYNKTRRVLTNLPDRDPVLFGLLADPRLQDIATKLAGPDFVYIPSEGNIFAGDTIWHTDEYNPHLHLPEGNTYFKVALYLDPMTRNHGGFRVVGGSQHQGDFYQLLQKYLKDNTAAYGLQPEQIPCSILESTPGDIIIFNYRTQHATCGTSHPRRMLYFGITSKFAGPNAHFASKTAHSLRKAFGRLYAEPLASSENPLLKNCTSQLLNSLTQ